MGNEYEKRARNMLLDAPDIHELNHDILKETQKSLSDLNDKISDLNLRLFRIEVLLEPKGKRKIKPTPTPTSGHIQFQGRTD